jgi:hypothetical protein
MYLLEKTKLNKLCEKEQQKDLINKEIIYSNIGPKRTFHKLREKVKVFKM